MTALTAAYIVGKTGAFHVPTIGHVEALLVSLAARLHSDITVAESRRVRTDLDLLLDKRQAMTAARAT